MSRQHYLMKQYFKFTRLFSEAMVKEVLKGLSENSNINKRVLSYICRSSRPKVFRKKGVLRNFTKFTGKHLCQSSKVAGLRLLLFCGFCHSYWRNPQWKTSFLFEQCQLGMNIKVLNSRLEIFCAVSHVLTEIKKRLAHKRSLIFVAVESRKRILE